MQGIQIEENNRYYLFDEKKLQEEYEKRTGIKKTKGCSVTDKPAIYNIKSSIAFNNPIRLIDTAGFGDVRGEEYDTKITQDIQDLFTKEIETLHAICLIFKATETRAHDRAKLVLDKLFSLFGKEIKNNIIIIFTFVDDPNNIEALRTLTDEKSPFLNILGNVNDLTHFEFNNQAYFTTNREMFEDIFENNAKSYGKLLKHVFNLNQISLESSKQVIKNRFDISNNIINVCNELVDVISKLNISIKNRQFKNELNHQMELNKKCDYKLMKVTKQHQVPYQEPYMENCSKGWYVLYCESCDKVCHRDCKGPKEGLHSTEYGCNAIGTLSCNCSYCKCHYSHHRFHDYIKKYRTLYKTENYIDEIPDPNSIATEKEKEKQREEISKKLEKNENELKQLDNQIHNSLKESIEKLSFIANKEKELNKIALKKYDNIKYGYYKEIIDETIQESKIKNVFNKILDKIESICSNETEKEKSINDILNLLNIS